MLDVNRNPEPFHLVITYSCLPNQIRAENTNNEICHYHFGKLFADPTIVRESLRDDLREQEMKMNS